MSPPTQPPSPAYPPPSPAFPPRYCPDGWVASPYNASYAHKCYKVLGGDSHYNCASRCAQAADRGLSTLVCIGSQEEQDNIPIIFGSELGYVWVGLYKRPDSPHGNGWNSWTSGCGSAYSNWRSGEPRQGELKACAYTYEGKWGSERCIEHAQCLCEFPATTTAAYLSWIPPSPPPPPLPSPSSGPIPSHAATITPGAALTSDAASASFLPSKPLPERVGRRSGRRGMGPQVLHARWRLGHPLGVRQQMLGSR